MAPDSETLRRNSNRRLGYAQWAAIFGGSALIFNWINSLKMDGFLIRMHWPLGRAGDEKYYEWMDDSVNAAYAGVALIAIAILCRYLFDPGTRKKRG